MIEESRNHAAEISELVVSEWNKQIQKHIEELGLDKTFEVKIEIFELLESEVKNK